MYGETNGTKWRRLHCKRCGEFYDHCKHTNTYDCALAGGEITPEHAERIRARYAFGREHNPDHDTADYTDDGVELPEAVANGLLRTRA